MLNEFVHTRVNQRVAIITIDNPPVNAMSPGVPGAIMAAVAQCNGDDGVDAMVLAGGGKGSIAGADIRFQGGRWPDGEPNLRDLIRLLDGNPKPVIAALGAHTLGGGLEIAMACTSRVATAAGMLGQPEVNLGIPPGAGGTQRLPRLAGLEFATQMILGGKPVSSEAALAHGIVDRVAKIDLLDEAIEQGLELAAGGSFTATRERRVDPPRQGFFVELRNKTAPASQGGQAAQACIDCLEAALTMDFDDGLQFEREKFNQCVGSAQAKALRHVFFAERRSGKPDNIGDDARPGTVQELAVIGAGTMGTGITIALLKGGFRVTLIEQSAEALERGRQYIDSTFERDVTKGRITGARKQAFFDALSCSTDPGDAATADMVIEAVFEEMEIKKEIFRTLAGATRPSTVLATNTSYLDINEIADVTGDRAADVLGTHFFSPANIMPLLEVVRARQTADQTLLTALEVGKRARKTMIVAGVCHGFVANRSLECYLREAGFLLEEGASPQQVDQALTDFGMAMGPFAVSDLAGLDIGWAKRRANESKRDKSRRYSDVSDRLCANGWFGQKTGRGFYLYEKGSRSGVPNPEVEKIIDDAARSAGITRRRIDSKEIIQRCFYSVINEAARILDEGMAQRASDIDVAWINGYGFPRWRGGPMFMADHIGLENILDNIKTFGETMDFWEAAPLIERLAADGRGFLRFQ